ncbi:unnamed protein product [Schistosoma mattheei]|uniref:Uncharacterized protein n=1 Tax=Schistosoma mattheei TaxID=31246 RepID=A0AA85C0S8_9TREM|nr:unnamed protein product [Schistosoma mattheei]
MIVVHELLHRKLIYHQVLAAHRVDNFLTIDDQPHLHLSIIIHRHQDVPTVFFFELNWIQLCSFIIFFYFLLFR